MKSLFTNIYFLKTLSFFIRIFRHNQDNIYSEYLIDYNYPYLNNSYLNNSYEKNIKNNKKTNSNKLYIFYKNIYYRLFFDKLKKIHIENIRNNINETKIFNCLCIEKIYNLAKTSVFLKLNKCFNKLITYH